MFKLENTMLKKSILSLGVASTLLMFSACNGDLNAPNGNSSSTQAVDGGKKYDTKNGYYTSYKVNTQGITKFGHGKEATENEIKAWDIDVMPDGTGLPEFDMERGKVVLDEDGKPKKAEGDVAWGNELYDSKCAMCHGDFGAGGKGYPKLSGGDISTLTYQLQNPADKDPGVTPPNRAIGSYWPYASTLFWYIQDAMPFPHPKSLTNSEVYALVAYLLYENGVKINGEELDEEYVLDREKFLTIKMPNKDGFYPNVDTPEDPKQGVKNMTNYLANIDNYGNGARCMTDCVKGEVPVLRIKDELNDFNPPANTTRDLPKVEAAGNVHPGQAGYEASCSACHSNDAIGAPVVGNKDAWAKVTKQSMKTILDHAINGFNAMPPKGGNMDLSDKEIKTIVEYMIESSK